MSDTISAANELKLAGVHPDLVRVFREAAGACRLPLRITEGVRTIERQRELYAQGRTKPGKIVTDTMNSRHLKGGDGYGKAIDIAPFKSDGSIDWNDLQAFMAVGLAMLAAAMSLGIPIRWGADWDRDGKFRERGEYDSPHFELLREKYP